MTRLHAQSLPDAISEEDQTLFHALVSLAAGQAPVDELLERVRERLGANQAVICYPDDPVPDGDHPVVAPLRYGEAHLADLYVDMPPDTDSLDAAARIQFFTPVLALVLGAGQQEARSQPWIADIQQERDRLEAVLEATNDAILMVNTAGILVTATQQFETFTGIPRYHLLGQPLEALAQRVEDQPGLPAGLASILRALVDNLTESLGGEFEIQEPQRRTLVWYSLPVHAQSGALLGRIFAFRDVTRERDVDRMKTDFISLVSHELRTPLTSVKGFSDLILELDEAALPAEVREYLDIIRFNADRLVTLINDILDITRIETERVELNPTLCPVSEIIAQVAASMRPMIRERGHHLTLDLEPSMPPVWADPARMTQIISNLLSNAIKYTLQPGELTVSACYVQSLDVLPEAAHRDQILPCVVVGVQDPGLGIAPEDQPHLFKRFYRANNEATRLIGGTGLGLMIVKAFVEMHGGQVWFESVLGEGSAFYFTVPVVEGKTLATKTTGI